MNDIPADSPLGQRILALATGEGVSDFYATPGDPLCYKKNGQLIFDAFVWEPGELPDMAPGCLDYAINITDLRFRVSRMVTQGRFRWVLRLLPKEIPSPRRSSAAAGGEILPRVEERALSHLRRDWQRQNRRRLPRW